MITVVQQIHITILSCRELRDSYREGNGNPLQYSCLENPMDGEAW